MDQDFEGDVSDNDYDQDWDQNEDDNNDQNDSDSDDDDTEYVNELGNVDIDSLAQGNMSPEEILAFLKKQ